MKVFTAGTGVERMLLYKAQLNKSPLIGTMELTPCCNMDCNMCYVRLPQKRMEELGNLRSLKWYLELGEQMVRAGALFLQMSGGEVLLYPDFEELFREYRKMGFILTINTNGTLIDAKWAAFFKEQSVRRVNVTLYGADNETYENLCHFPSGFDKVMRGIDLLLDKGVDVKVNFILTPQNEKQIEKIVSICEHKGLYITNDAYLCAAIRERENEHQEGWRLLPKDAAKAAIRMVKTQSDGAFMDSFRHDCRLVEEYDGSKFSDSLTCQAGRSSFAVTWQGIMMPCITMEGITYDLKSGSFANGWDYIVRETDMLRIDTKCTTCRRRPLCPNCAANAKSETGRYDAAPDYLCQYAQALYDTMKQELKMNGET